MTALLFVQSFIYFAYIRQTRTWFLLEFSSMCELLFFWKILISSLSLFFFFFCELVTHCFLEIKVRNKEWNWVFFKTWSIFQCWTQPGSLHYQLLFDWFPHTFVHFLYSDLIYIGIWIISLQSTEYVIYMNKHKEPTLKDVINF